MEKGPGSLHSPQRREHHHPAHTSGAKSALLADDDLWQRLLGHHIGPRDVPLRFAARLARENGWSLAFAERAIVEYKKFCYLAMRSAAPVTPSHAVDQVWHLHLCYTRDYWSVFCPQVLGGDLHHGPTEGGPAKAFRYRAQYAQTLRLLEASFGALDAALWPGVVERFASAPHLQTLDLRAVWLVRKPTWRGLARRLSAGIAAALVLLPMLLPMLLIAQERPFYDPSGPDFLKFTLLAMLAAAVWSWLALGFLRRGAPIARIMTPVELGLVAGGFARAVEVAEVELVQAEVLTVTSIALRDSGTPSALRTSSPAHVVALRQANGHTNAIKNAPELLRWHDQLVAQKLLRSTEQLWRARWIVCAPWLVIVALEIARWLIGAARDKPVGFVIFLLAICSIVALVLGKSVAIATPEAQQRLRIHRRNVRLKTAPTSAECALACGVFGAAALEGSALSAYYTMRHPPGSGSSDSGASGGDSGGGSGGSGCGGCGGD